MGWISRLSARYGGRSYNKGTYYYRSGRVLIETGSDEFVEAAVRGSALYAVCLEMKSYGLEVSCTCPWFKDTASLCKHIWATIQAADSEGYLSSMASMSTPAIRTAPDGSRPPAERKRTPEWRRKLSLVREAAARRLIDYAEPPQDSAGQQLCYLIDIRRSRSLKRVVLRIASRKRKKNGEWGKIPFYEQRVQMRGITEPADQRIVASIQGAKDDHYSAYSYEPDSIPANYGLKRELAALLIPELCRTGRCFIFSSDKDLAAPTLVSWDDGPPWTFELEVRSNSDKTYMLDGLLRRESEALTLSQCTLMAPDVVVSANRIATFKYSDSKEWISVLENGPISVPAEEASDFLAELLSTHATGNLKLPPELEPQRWKLSSPPLLRIHSSKSLSGDYLDCEVFFRYENNLIPWNHPAVLLTVANNPPLLRDQEAEQKELSRLAPLGFVSFPQHASVAIMLPPGKVPEAVRGLSDAGWTIEAEGKPYRRAGSIRIEVKTGIDWFELEGAAVFEDQTAALPDLLKAIRRGETMIRLDDGSVGLIPEEWLRRYGMTAAIGGADGKGFRFSRGQAGLLNALLALQPDVEWDAGFKRIRENLQRFEGIAPSNPKNTFAGKLREYQREGLGWLQFLREFGFGGCLADDMGLGKTVQVLALLDLLQRRRSKSTLVVAPKSLVFNWRDEAARFTPKLRILDHTGAARPKAAAHFENADVVLTTYGVLRRDILLFKEIHFDTVILDEAQAIKNAQTDSAKAARLLHADHKLALTGTPVENHLGELWSLFEFLNPGLLGAASAFNSSLGAADDASREVLKRTLRPFILRRTKDQVAKDLPPKLEQTIFCEMEKEQKKVYEELRNYFRQSLLQRIESEGLQKSKIHVLEALLRLRQAACHPALIDASKAGSSAKLDALIPQLVEVIEEGHKVLVFSQFTSFLKIVQEALDRQGLVYEYLDGQTHDRAARVKRFQSDPKCPLFLISLKAGGLGLNLTAADYVFLLDPWWNPAVENQAIDRTHRIGQTRHVFAYRLIAKNTVEERVLELQQTKRDLANAIIGGENSVLRGLTREHLELLLS
jgi:superfamily II DNA or RNA helicase